MTERTPNTPSPAHKSARLRTAGVLALILGIIVAALVYWLGTRSPDISDDPSMLGFNRAQTRQMEQLYGKSGLLVNEWLDDLKRPRTQAILIVSVSVVASAACFYFARLVAVEDSGDGN